MIDVEHGAAEIERPVLPLYQLCVCIAVACVFQVFQMRCLAGPPGAAFLMA
jgi:hypothetical protein